MNFQQLVLTVAGVLLVITLVVMGFVIKFGNRNKKYPPVVGVCPDYWEESDAGNGMSKCKNVHNLGSCGSELAYDPSYASESVMNCHRSQWAKSCDLTWDGVTNVPDICGKVA